ncbi:MAG: dTMP kinase [Acholeplasmatales bacterium]|jgi:dTMP kinase|nr:dTMP kinase [Acholeplasmatales bacterium]
MFITFEGGEGSGKTTLIANIKRILFEKGFDCITTREPGGSFVAEAIRTVVLDPIYKGVSKYTEALLYAASRAQHLDDVIIPALKENKIVICDRFLDSSLAYQAYGRDLGIDFVLAVNTYALKYIPDLTFYIDIAPEIGLERIKTRSKKDRLDNEANTFHTKVREGYLKLVDLYTERIIKIDGKLPIVEIEEIIMKKLEEKLWN